MPANRKARTETTEALETEAFETEAPETEAPETEAPETEAPEPPVRLEGSDLLAFYNEQLAAGLAHAEIAKAAGYYTVTSKGAERLMLARFNEKFLAAQGHDLGPGKSRGSGRSRAGLSQAKVTGNGSLLVSHLAVQNCGGVQGQIFQVEYPTGDFIGPGAQILLTLTEEIVPIKSRTRRDEQPGTPLLDQATA